jgi:DNA cross-link repair 1B protein
VNAMNKIPIGPSKNNQPMRIPETPICIDGFKHTPDVQFYLLSHLHADHTSGLSPSWNFGTIYCTSISKAILCQKFKVDEKYIVVLELEKTYTFPIEYSNASIEITCFDANHCLGSCMFLIRGYFGTILCTGDFRYDPFMLKDFKNTSIDYLYLDDTFIDSEAIFPTREEAGKQIENIIAEYPNEYRILVAADTLGKEELFINLALKFDTLIVIPPERLEILDKVCMVVNLPNVFTIDPNEGRIHVVSKKELTFERIHEERRSQPTLGILPSGLLKLRPNQYIKHVQYSLHSSRNELEEFVKALKPKRLVSTSRHDNLTLLEHFSKYLSGETPLMGSIVRKREKCVKRIERVVSKVIDLTKDLDPEEEQICKILKRTHDREYKRDEFNK